MNLLTPIITHRIIGNWYYTLTFVFWVFSFYLIRRRKIVRIGLLLYGVGCFLNFAWEMTLILFGFRAYQSSFPFILHLSYHSLTEFAPFMIILVIILEKLKCFDLTQYGDEHVATK